MSRRRLTVLMGLLWGAGCARELDLPAPGSAARLTTLSPTAAYGGQVLSLSGSGFDPDPAANQVVFPGATALAFSSSAEQLQVRVPRGAGSGPISVTTRRGTSVPLAGFTYLGGGQLAQGQVVSKTPLLHAPSTLLTLDGGLYLNSRVASGLVRVGDPSFYLRGGFLPPFTGGGALYTSFLEQTQDGTDGGPGFARVTLTRLDPSDGGTTVRYVVPALKWYALGYVKAPGGDLLLGVGPDPSNPQRWAVWPVDPVTMADLDAGPISLDILAGGYLDDCGGGVAVFPIVPAGSDGGALGVLVLDGGTVRLQVVDPAHRTFDIPTMGTVCARGPGADGGTHSLALATTSSGAVAVADLDLTPPAFTGTDFTLGSSGRPRAARFVGDGMVAVAMDTEGVVLGVDLSTRSVRWATRAAQPIAVAAFQGNVWVAQGADSALLALDPQTGRLLNSVRVPVVPGTEDGYQGLVFAPPDLGTVAITGDRLYLPISYPPLLIRYTLGQTPTPQPFVKPRFPVLDSTGQLWAAGDLQLELPGVPPITLTLPNTPRRVAFGAQGLALVGHDQGITLARPLSPSMPSATVPFEGPRFDSVGFLPSGDPYWVVQTAIPDAGVSPWELLGITGASSGAGQAFGVRLTAGAGDVLEDATSVLLEDGLWIFTQSLAGGKAQLIEPTTSTIVVKTLNEGAPLLGNLTRNLTLGNLTQNIRLGNGHAGPPLPSPNRRTFVSWKDAAQGGTDLHIRSGDPWLRFADQSFVHLDGLLHGLTFDLTGERLYVLTRDPEELILLQ